mgnify:CR=1 FL=1
MLLNAVRLAPVAAAAPVAISSAVPVILAVGAVAIVGILAIKATKFSFEVKDQVKMNVDC